MLKTAVAKGATKRDRGSKPAALRVGARCFRTRGAEALRESHDPQELARSTFRRVPGGEMAIAS
jgi:hypothetical protein